MSPLCCGYVSLFVSDMDMHIQLCMINYNSSVQICKYKHNIDYDFPDFYEMFLNIATQYMVSDETLYMSLFVSDLDMHIQVFTS